MCGIAGLVYTDPQRPVDRETLVRMTAVMAHRGPDAEGFHVAPGLGLGHRRLAILDLDGGAQPLANEDGSVVVVLNGEIYNHAELRRELAARGHRFRTRSDTEAIVHAYAAFGDACVDRLRGMFAFALWDARRRRLLLARDRVGKKPLFYHWDGARLAFASELKALTRDPALSPTVDLEAMHEFLALGAVPSPRSIYREVRQLGPAQVLTWDAGRIAVREYWDVAFGNARRACEAEYLEEFQAILDEAVHLRMISDVPLGAFLSGGVDSTAVVAAMAARAAAPVRTVSVGFRERAYSELPHAGAVARALGTDHRELTVTVDAAALLPRLVWHLDEPFADSSALPTYLLARAAREQVTVALSGDGGDELFAGYQRRHGLVRWESVVRRLVPARLRSGVFGPLARLYPKADWLPRPLRAKTVLGNLATSLEHAYFRDVALFRPDERRALLTPELRRTLGAHDPFESVARWFRRTEGLDPLSRVLYADFKSLLVHDILVKVDRMSMASGLEVRSPLLDHEVVEFAARLPVELKYRGRTSKYFLKRHLAGRAPRSAIHRPKMGFSIPLALWLRGGLRGLAEDVLFAPHAAGRGYFDMDRVRRLWTTHQRGLRDHSAQLWGLLVLELWHRTFVDAGRPLERPA